MCSVPIVDVGDGDCREGERLKVELGVLRPRKLLQIEEVFLPRVGCRCRGRSFFKLSTIHNDDDNHGSCDAIKCGKIT